MAYFEINFDPLIALAKITGAPISNPLNLLGLAETAGVSGISFGYGTEIGQMNNLGLLRSMSSSRINIRVPADMQMVQKVILLRPNLITLYNPDVEDGSLEIPSKLVKELVAAVIHTENVGLALRLKPDVKCMKEAYQMGIDEVEIATNELGELDSRTAFLECLGKITHAIRIGTRNNLRVSAGGALHQRTIRALNEVIDVEFMSVGRALLAQAFLRGFDTAVREFMSIIEIS